MSGGDTLYGKLMSGKFDLPSLPGLGIHVITCENACKIRFLRVFDEIAVIRTFRLAAVLLFVSRFHQAADGAFTRKILFSLGRGVLDVYRLLDRRRFNCADQARL